MLTTLLDRLYNNHHEMQIDEIERLLIEIRDHVRTLETIPLTSILYLVGFISKYIGDVIFTGYVIQIYNHMITSYTNSFSLYTHDHNTMKEIWSAMIIMTDLQLKQFPNHSMTVESCANIIHGLETIHYIFQTHKSIQRSLLWLRVFKECDCGQKNILKQVVSILLDTYDTLDEDDPYLIEFIGHLYDKGFRPDELFCCY